MKQQQRAIILKPHEVRSILDGKQAQFRRVLKPQPEAFERSPGCAVEVYPYRVDGQDFDRIAVGRVITTQRMPYQPGDILWVREAAYFAPNRCAYAADNPPLGRGERVKGWGRVTPSIHMPRWASRLTLAVTETRVQRLQDISEEDVWAEGVEPVGNGAAFVRAGDAQIYGTPRTCFATLWNGLNEKRGFGWSANPWVVAVTFKPQRREGGGSPEERGSA